MTDVPEEWLPPHPLRQIEGDEHLLGVDATVLDFWRWGFSDLRLNIVRGVLAEFLLASGRSRGHAQGGVGELRRAHSLRRPR